MANETQNPSDASTSPAQSGTPKASGASMSRVDHASTSSGTAMDSSTSGKTTIAEGVVSKVAGIAARAVPGVFALGGGGARAMGALRDAFNATDPSQGIKVEVGETQAAVDLTLVVEYPAPIQEVCDNVRASVAGAIHTLVGLEVVEVNIAVNDVHLPGEESEPEESRVS
ncbi:Asp23/Gls24 family envelope stress response protein [Cryobacterium psychrophilum]|uniref:Asp23/Gls24 family envelope stress response protein n=1 Tax=Cryobacterium psychrophilum TaxID=41988 RepID=A0A4Y8KVV1_9MICO|nr:Asp23/Gls24 family envelope stress response protein [Cryobacterium psychrophilum]TDW29628.1 putative alkaline shock family protein YloU [Cryobacterium psychrophilum]TFD81750.1 Asp23/Gls24 family envelope stress response protein [Cryobacterium psychrophilum]